MAQKAHGWIKLWLVVSIPIIFWDIGYCFMRPRSMRGGDLHWIWKPYEIYQEVDYLYGELALKEGNGFTNAQSLLNLAENLLNIISLVLYSSSSALAPLLTLITASLTVAKTVLYWAQEYYCGYCAIGHNNTIDLIRYWIIPNGIWIIVPSAIIYTLWGEVANDLKIAKSVREGKKKE